MRHSCSPSTPPSSASRSPCASLFDLQSMFQCGCTSDVAEHDEAQKQVAEPQKPQQESDKLEKEEELIMMESAKEYMDRISTQLKNMEDQKRKDAWKNPQRSKSAPNENDQANIIDTIFRNRSSSVSTSDSTFPSLKHTDSVSTQSTSGLTDDELSTSSTSANDAEEPVAMAKPVLVSILRRKVKLGVVEIASKGGSVTFSPKTVFPDPNQAPKRRKRVPRINSKMRCESYESQVEQRRLVRRTQQNQHPYISDDLRSPSNDFLQQTESFYVFR